MLVSAAFERLNLCFSVCMATWSVRQQPIKKAIILPLLHACKPHSHTRPPCVLSQLEVKRSRHPETHPTNTQVGAASHLSIHPTQQPPHHTAVESAKHPCTTVGASMPSCSLICCNITMGVTKKHLPWRPQTPMPSRPKHRLQMHSPSNSRLSQAWRNGPSLMTPRRCVDSSDVTDLCTPRVTRNTDNKLRAKAPAIQHISTDICTSNTKHTHLHAERVLSTHPS